MSPRSVENAIRKVRRQMADYSREYYGWSYNETGTRYVLIDPVIKALGWDIYDMDQCGVDGLCRARNLSDAQITC